MEQEDVTKWKPFDAHGHNAAHWTPPAGGIADRARRAMMERSMKQRSEPDTSDQPLPPAEELPLPVPGKCLFCGQPGASGDPLSKDAQGWWMHFRCAVELHSAANKWA
jgi:hypothetical protein